jgi:hypothetical protein
VLFLQAKAKLAKAQASLSALEYDPQRFSKLRTLRREQEATAAGT